MRFGVYVPTSGEYDVPTLVSLARETEELGYDGMFLWDNILTTFDDSGALVDATVALTAVVLATQYLHCGLLVTPLARRRPWKVAKETATLDQLSRGRLVVGVGSGGTWDFAPFHEAPPGPARGERLDEALDVLTACWTGLDVHYRGRHFTVDGARMRPVPVQQPRIPIWVAGYWPGTAPFRRAARWDGVVPLRRDHTFAGLTVAEFRDCLAYVRAHRGGDGPFDAVYFHTSAGVGSAGSVSVASAGSASVGSASDNSGSASDGSGSASDGSGSASVGLASAEAALVEAYEAAGATWWLESTNPATESRGAFVARVRARAAQVGLTTRRG